MSDKKVLIISYYWPPSGGSGVQRWLKLTKYLSQFGWQAHVLTPENPEFDQQDKSLLAEVGQDVKVHKCSIWEPFSVYKKLFPAKSNQGLVPAQQKKNVVSNAVTWVRGNLFVPDPRVFWRKTATKKAKEIIYEEGIDLIITTGPPHSMHLIGLDVKRDTDIKWIADFRDPWSKLDILAELKATKAAVELQKRLERKVLKKADLTLTVSKVWANELQVLGANEVAVVTNGFDHEDFNSVIKKKSDKFLIQHFGLINHLRFPYAFFEAVKQLLAELGGFKDKLEINLTGTIDSQLMTWVTEQKDLKDVIKFAEPITHKEVLQAYHNGHLNLLLLNKSDNADGHIPGKLFEYLATRIPILGIGSTSGDSARIIRETQTGEVCGFDDVAAIKNNIQMHYESFLNGQHQQVGLEDEIAKYSRQHTAQQLSTVLNNVLG